MAKNESTRSTKLMTGAHQKGLKSVINCAGYALGVNEWMDLDDYVNDWNVLPDVAAWLEKDFNLEAVGIYKTAQAFLDDNRTAGHYLFYRASGFDYHFMVMTQRGYVYDKPGRTPYRKKPLRQSALMQPRWGSVYDSDILVMRFTGDRG